MREVSGRVAAQCSAGLAAGGRRGRSGAVRGLAAVADSAIGAGFGLAITAEFDVAKSGNLAELLEADFRVLVIAEASIKDHRACRLPGQDVHYRGAQQHEDGR